MTTIRPARQDDAPQLARVHVQAWHETYRGLMPDAVIDRQSVEARTAMWTRALDPTSQSDSFTLLLEDADELVGFASGGPVRGDEVADHLGELYAIYVLRSHQGRGLGRRLFKAVEAGLRERGLAPFLLWVLAGNEGAAGFYAHLGGEPVGTKVMALEGGSLDKLALGWR